MSIDDIESLIKLISKVAGDGWQFRVIKNPPEVNGCIINIIYCDSPFGTSSGDMAYGSTIVIGTDMLDSAVAPVSNVVSKLMEAIKIIEHRQYMDKKLNHD